jgi:hypothetical protein
MGMPTGEIVAKPLVARACGCLREFQHFAKDKYREQRLALFQKTRCEVCVSKLNEEQKRAAAALPKVGTVFRSLPAGTQLTMTRRADGAWAGTLAAGASSVEGAAGGPQELTALLARLWAEARGGEAKRGPG